MTAQYKNLIQRSAARVAFALLFCVFTATTVLASVDAGKTSEISILRGELETFNVKALTRISITNPEVADVVEATDKEVLVVAKAPGSTALFLWDEEGKHMIMVNVYSQSLELTKSRISSLFEAAGIEADLAVNTQEGKVVIKGDIASENMSQFNQIIEPFGRDIINLAKEESSKQLVQIDVQVTEMNATSAKDLGIDWSGNAPGTSTTDGNSSVVLDYQETLPATDGKPEDFFKIGDFNRTSALLAKVNALIEEGNARVLSKPSLVVISGEEANFLVGGEIPIRTTTFSTSGSSQENVEFKDYGIGMNITPEIKKEKIDIRLSVEISDVDASAPAGDDDVAFVTRNAQTRLFLNNHQTIVMAGLIRQLDNKNVKQIPVLGKIPVLGALFRKTTTPVLNQDTELVIALTPHILNYEEKDYKTHFDGYKKALQFSDGETIDAQRGPQDVSTGTETPLKVKATEEVAVKKVAIPEPNRVKAEEDEPARETNVQVSRPAGPHSSLDEYIWTVQQKISSSVRFPSEAEENGWEGTVKIGLLILKDGTLAYALVKESSGYEIFDQYALNTAKAVAPYTQFPADIDLQELSVTVPIVYSLRSN